MARIHPFPMVWQDGAPHRVQRHNLGTRSWIWEPAQGRLSHMQQLAVVTVAFPAPQRSFFRPMGSQVLNVVPPELSDQVAAFAIEGDSIGVNDRHIAEVGLYKFGRP